MGNQTAERASSGLLQTFDCQKLSREFPFGFIVAPNERGRENGKAGKEDGTESF